MIRKTCDSKKIVVWLLGPLSKLLLLLILTTPCWGQQSVDLAVFDKQGGIEISLDDLSQVKELVQHPGVTLDHGCSHSTAKIYVTLDGYEYLKSKTIDFTYHPRPAVQLTMKGPEEILSYRSDCLPAMDFYPTYDAYVSMMETFAQQYPELCSIRSIGTLDSGRDIWVAHIHNKEGGQELAPNFFYTSTMHGDETAGFPIMLQLIDYLLCNYDNDDRVQQLVDNVNIFVNPLANPDGTYTNDNRTLLQK